MNDVSTTFSPAGSSMLPLFSSGLDLTNPTHTPSPIPGSLTQPLSLDVVPPSVAPTDVIRPPDRPTTTTRRHETRRGDRLQMARTALDNWRKTRWRDKYSDSDTGPRLLLPDCTLRKLATKAHIRTITQLRAVCYWCWADEYLSEVLKVLDDSDALWRAEKDLAIQQRKENRAKVSAQNRIVRDEQRRHEKYIQRRLHNQTTPPLHPPDLPDGRMIGSHPPPLSTPNAMPPMPYTLSPHQAHTHLASSSVPIPRTIDPTYFRSLPKDSNQDTSTTSCPTSTVPITAGSCPPGYYWSYTWVPMPVPITLPSFNPVEHNSLPNPAN